MPFLAEHLWQNLVAGAADDAPDSVFLARWPEPAEPDSRLLDEVADVRRVVELGRQARSVSGLKLRQPLRRLVVQGASLAEGHRDEIADELRVKEVEFGPVEAAELRVKPNLPVLGPKLGRELGLCACRSRGRRLRAGGRRALPRGRSRARPRRGARRAPRARGLDGRGGRRLRRRPGHHAGRRPTARGSGARPHPPGEHDAS